MNIHSESAAPDLEDAFDLDVRVMFAADSGASRGAHASATPTAISCTTCFQE